MTEWKAEPHTKSSGYRSSPGQPVSELFDVLNTQTKSFLCAHDVSFGLLLRVAEYNPRYYSKNSLLYLIFVMLTSVHSIWAEKHNFFYNRMKILDFVHI